MKKIVKVVALVLAFIALWILLTPIVFAMPSATSDFYVNDFANVFSDEEKQHLMDNAISLANDYDGTQVVVTTIESLDGRSVEEYAADMYNDYGIGKDDMGVLILLATSDRKIRIEVGYAMEAYITDGKSGQLIDKYAIPYLRDNNFNDGLICLQDALISEIVSCLDKEKTQAPETNLPSRLNPEPTLQDSGEDTDGTLNSYLLIFIILFVLLFAFVVVFFCKKISQKNEKIDSLSNALKEEQSKLKKNTDLFDEYKSMRDLELKEDRKRYATDLENTNKKHEDKISAIEAKASRMESSLKSEISELSKFNNSLSVKLSDLQDRYERVNKLHPGADDEVTAMIEEEKRNYDISKANSVDELIAEVINLSADKDITDRLSSILSSYSDLTDSQKEYVKSDVQKLRTLYDSSLSLKKKYERELEEERIRQKEEEDKKEANSAEASIRDILSGIKLGKAENLDDLRRGYRIYEALSHDARSYFDSSLLSQLKKLTHDAEKDLEEKRVIERDKKKAKEVENYITSVTQSIYRGRASNLRNLKDAKSKYDLLGYSVQQYIDSSTISTLDRLICEAKRDKEDQEEEERRRRNSTSFSSFSSMSSGFGGGHSGFGGHSGGGGASRGF